MKRTFRFEAKDFSDQAYEQLLIFHEATDLFEEVQEILFKKGELDFSITVEMNRAGDNFTLPETLKNRSGVISFSYFETLGALYERVIELIFDEIDADKELAAESQSRHPSRLSMGSEFTD